MTQCTTRGRERNDSVGNENLKTYYAEKILKKESEHREKKQENKKKKKIIQRLTRRWVSIG